MGLETAFLVGSTVFSTISTIQQGKAQAKAKVAEGNIALKNKAKEIAYKTATQTTSFLNSGLTLDGTPMNVINSTYNTGLEDLSLIGSNYDKAAKNIMSEARTKAISGLATDFAGASFGGNSFSNSLGFGSANSLNTALGASWFGSSIDGTPWR